MSDLTEFLLARIAEDEAVARAVRPDEYLPTRDSMELQDEAEGTYRYIAVKSGRVLAECAAKRSILVEHAPQNWDWEKPGAQPHCERCAKWEAAGYDGPDNVPSPCLTLLALAAPYASNPDFDPSWAGGTQP